MVLKDRVALITGAGRGIGRAIALCFADEGTRIAVTGRDVSRLTQVVDDILGVDAVEENILEAHRLHPEIASRVTAADLRKPLEVWPESP